MYQSPHACSSGGVAETLQEFLARRAELDNPQSRRGVLPERLEVVDLFLHPPFGITPGTEDFEAFKILHQAAGRFVG